MKLAIIDQDLVFGKLLAENLRAIGFSHINACCHSSIARLRIEQGREDIFIVEAHERFRELYSFLQTFPEPPMLILSFLGQIEPYAIGKAIDWDGFLPKLFTRTYLSEVMSDVLLCRRAQRRKLVVMPSAIPGRRRIVSEASAEAPGVAPA